MQNINIPGRLMKDIRSFAMKNNVEKIILFGSRARGTHYERSDVDLAVEGGDFDGFLSDIQEMWLLMLSKRNENIHIYDDKVIDELIVMIRDSFIPTFKKLAEVLKTKISEVGEGF